MGHHGAVARAVAARDGGYAARVLNAAHWQLSINNLPRWPLVVCGIRANIFADSVSARRMCLLGHQYLRGHRAPVPWCRSVAALYSRRYSRAIAMPVQQRLCRGRSSTTKRARNGCGTARKRPIRCCPVRHGLIEGENAAWRQTDQF